MQAEPNPDKILVVDDNVTNRYTVARYLKAAGYEVVEAGTGREGLRLAAELPALVILDIQMPDLTGLEVCKLIKSAPATAAIPVLHTSATFRSVHDKSHGLEQGADAYLTCPFEPEELVATVKALIRMKRAEGKAQKLANEWHTTFEAISDGICVVRADGTIRRHNQAFHTILGKPDETLAGRPLAAVLAEAEILESPLSRMRESQRREVAETRRGDRYLRITADPIEAEKNLAGEAVFILQDVTERRQAEAELRAAKEQLRLHAEELEERVADRTMRLAESVKSLEGLLYHVAHDLRAPLRTMHSFTQLLLEEYGTGLDATGEDYAQRISEASGKMDALICDLLSYGHLGHQAVAPASVDLNWLVDKVVAQFEIELRNRPAEIKVDKPLPRVWADPLILEQVLVNLVDNGLKFVPADTTPRLHIRAEADGETVRLHIQDNGIGIKKEYQKRIFQVFERLHGDELYSGTGIGLAIVKRGMERMQGSVGVESEPNAGSCFQLELKQVAT